MKAEELRIGNWVNIGYPKQFELSDFQDYFGDWKKDVNDAVEPIPLTAEILEKAGFELTGNFDHHTVESFQVGDDFEIQFSNVDTDHAFVYWTEAAGGNGKQKAVYFKYLHQLQNLYFAHLNKELQIDLSK